jgi:hypothetical protein
MLATPPSENPKRTTPSWSAQLNDKKILPPLDDIGSVLDSLYAAASLTNVTLETQVTPTMETMRLPPDSCSLHSRVFLRF